MTTSKNLLNFVQGSQLTVDGAQLRNILSEARHKSDQVMRVGTDIQNPYSIRCAPQILGAIRDLLSFVHGVIQIEVNSVTDNPLIFSEDKDELHGGNFYGQHVSFASDILGLAITKLAMLSERRFARYIDEKFNQGLPAFLVKGEEIGLRNGFMGVQMVTTALAAEIRNLNDHASVSTIPTNANNQDVVSMGTPAAKKLIPMIQKAQDLFSYELLALTQAADFRGPEKLSRAGKMLYKEVRKVVPFLEKDRPFRPDIQKVTQLIKNRVFTQGLETMLSA
jgi:tyrosine ammonia-lyase